MCFEFCVSLRSDWLKSLFDCAMVPKVEKITPAIIKVNGHGCFAPIAQSVGLPALVKATKEIGIGALTLTGIHHFAALWPETEYLADNGLVGIACTAYMPSVAPAGSKTALFGKSLYFFLPPLIPSKCSRIGLFQHTVPPSPPRFSYLPPPLLLRELEISDTHL